MQKIAILNQFLNYSLMLIDRSAYSSQAICWQLEQLHLYLHVYWIFKIISKTNLNYNMQIMYMSKIFFFSVRAWCWLPVQHRSAQLTWVTLLSCCHHLQHRPTCKWKQISEWLLHVHPNTNQCIFERTCRNLIGRGTRQRSCPWWIWTVPE